MKQRTRYCYGRLLSLILTMLVFGGTFALTGCRPDDHRVTVSPELLYFSNSDSKAMPVQIHTEGEWFVSEVSPFISVSPNRGSNYSTMYVKMAEKNDSSLSRQGRIVIQSIDDPQYTATVHVLQYDKDYGY